MTRGAAVPIGGIAGTRLARNGGHDAAPEHLSDGINGGGPGDRGGDCRLRGGQQGRRGRSARTAIVVAGVVRITACVRIRVTARAGHIAGHACGTRLADREVPGGPAALAAAESAAWL